MISAGRFIVIALGGNAFQSKSDKGTVEEYWKNAYSAADVIVKLVEDGYRVAVTHGNGPQVGVIAELIALGERYKGLPPMSLDIAGAMSQGWLGYILQQAIYNKLYEKKLIPSVIKGVVTVITQTVVRGDDPDFKNPSKFIGPWYNEEEVKRLTEEHGWFFRPDPRGGYRRVVPSPDPIIQVEIDAIKTLLNNNYVIIADGGGGIPVVRENGKLAGIEGVVDKDLGAERMATALGADVLLILTDVDHAYVDYGTSRAKALRELTLSEAIKYYSEGHFKPGSMGPKILAAIRFIQNGGKLAIIGNLRNAQEAIRGELGTWI
ncbi:MAG: carbamate kinase, partial [Desulfurococcaceae archaeon]